MADSADWLSAAHAARMAFGLEHHDLELVTVGENVTYRAARAGADSFVLRLHRPGYHSLEELDSERIWLAALSRAGISVPEPAAAPDGRFFVPVTVAEGDVRFAGLTRWRDGEVMADLQSTLDVPPSIREPFAQLGELMGHMHGQAAGWEAPAGFVRQRLDADGLLGDDPFWGRFWEVDELTDDQKQHLSRARELARIRLLEYGEPAETFSVIHADLHLGNLLVDAAGRLSVIDFDDAGYGWHQYDMAVALLHVRGTPDADAAEEAFVEAYRRVRPLAHDDLAWIPFFEAVRLMALVGWKGQRPEVQWSAGRFEGLVEAALAATVALGLV